jgi:hypothetical protein
MAVKYVCDQTAVEVSTDTMDEVTHTPKLPDGWVQEIVRQPDSSYKMMHFSSLTEQKNWHDANP